jgi:ABC-type lipoprotein release transport system permease subunit
MQKHKKILEYTVSSLVRRKYKNLALVAVFSFVIAILASILFLTHSFKVEAFNVLLDAPELIVQKISGGRHDFIPRTYMKKIQEIYGVGNVTPRYWGYYYDSGTDSNYTLLGVDESVQGLKLLDGRFPTEKGECAIGRGTFSKGIGEHIDIADSKGKPFRMHIIGIFGSDSDLLANNLVLLTKENILDVFGMLPDRATDIVVQVYNESEVPYVARKIRNEMPDTRPIMKSEIIRTYDSVFSWRSGMIIIMFSGALIAFCILAWDKATGLNTDEKQEIGILKAIGWETSDILEMKFWEGLVLSLTSFIIGILLAYVHILFFHASLIAPALKGWSTIFPEFRLIPSLNLYHVFTMFFLTVVPYIASTIVPSWKAAITDPDLVMRG